MSTPECNKVEVTLYKVLFTTLLHSGVDVFKMSYNVPSQNFKSLL